MNYDEIREAVMELREDDQKRLILEVIPDVWPNACQDTSCAFKIKDLVDKDIWRSYDEIHIGGI